MALPQRAVRKLVRTGRKVAASFRAWRDRATVRLEVGTPIGQLNEWQAAFCEWQGRRSGFGEEEIRRRFLESLNRLRGGHRSPDFSRYAMVSHALYLPFVSDTPTEVIAMYEFHAPMHFLAHLSHPPVVWPADLPIFEGICDLETVAICDFGCGLAHQSVTLGREMRARGKRVTLHLCDVPPINLEFLDWSCAREGFETETWRCTAKALFPPFSPCTILIATEILKHVHDPVNYVDNLDRLVAADGVVVTNTTMHKAHFGHVSPDLGAARNRFLELGYSEPIKNRMFRKPAN
jgi:2-polyprenyl-3-methyl-5-hydroxy-6-metoxy-1,4-benzoquinol methylase